MIQFATITLKVQMSESELERLSESELEEIADYIDIVAEKLAAAAENDISDCMSVDMIVKSN